MYSWISKYFNIHVTVELLNICILGCFLGYSVFATAMWTVHTCPSRTSLYTPLESVSEHPTVIECEKLAESTHKLRLQVAELRRLVEEESEQ